MATPLTQLDSRGGGVRACADHMDCVFDRTGVTMELHETILLISDSKAKPARLPYSLTSVEDDNPRATAGRVVLVLLLVLGIGYGMSGVILRDPVARSTATSDAMGTRTAIPATTAFDGVVVARTTAAVARTTAANGADHAGEHSTMGKPPPQVGVGQQTGEITSEYATPALSSPVGRKPRMTRTTPTALANETAATVRQMMSHTWKKYKQKGWPHDDVKPVSGKSSDWIGYSVQIIEALETLFLMEMEDEFQEGMKLFHDQEFEPGKFAEGKAPMCTFEIVIRALGGLVGMADLLEFSQTSEEHVATLDALSLSVGKKLLQYAFGQVEVQGHLAIDPLSSRVLPYPAVHLNSGRYLDWGSTFFLVEVGSIQLEFRALARRQNDPTLSLHPDLVLEMILQSGSGAKRHSKNTAGGGKGKNASITTLNPDVRNREHVPRKLEKSFRQRLVSGQTSISTNSHGSSSKTSGQTAAADPDDEIAGEVDREPPGLLGSELHLGQSTRDILELLFDPRHNLPSRHLAALPLQGSLSFSGRTSISARADSYYEYLLKLYLLGGKKDTRLLQAFANVVADAERELIRVSADKKSAFLGSVESGEFVPRMDHLSCFFPGALELAANEALNVDVDAKVGPSLDARNPGSPQTVGEQSAELAERWRTLARQLGNTCVRMYTENAPYFLAPEYVDFDADRDELKFAAVREDPSGRKNLLRPETLESLYYLRYFTERRAMPEAETYQEAGKKIVESFLKHGKAEFGFSALDTVTGERLDSQESFFVAETLKYAYLLFAPLEVLSLETFVLSTEAHPMRRAAPPESDSGPGLGLGAEGAGARSRAGTTVMTGKADDPSPSRFLEMIEEKEKEFYNSQINGKALTLRGGRLVP